MNKNQFQGATRLCRLILLGALLPALLLSLNLRRAEAASATWNSLPFSGDWNTATNWTPTTVPNGPGDTATFDISNVTSVALSASTQVDGITFTPNASAYTIAAGGISTFLPPSPSAVPFICALPIQMIPSRTTELRWMILLSTPCRSLRFTCSLASACSFAVSAFYVTEPARTLHVSLLTPQNKQTS